MYFENTIFSMIFLLMLLIYKSSNLSAAVWYFYCSFHWVINLLNKNLLHI